MYNEEITTIFKKFIYIFNFKTAFLFFFLFSFFLNGYLWYLSINATETNEDKISSIRHFNFIIVISLK